MERASLERDARRRRWLARAGVACLLGTAVALLANPDQAKVLGVPFYVGALLGGGPETRAAAAEHIVRLGPVGRAALARVAFSSQIARPGEHRTAVRQAALDALFPFERHLRGGRLPDDEVVRYLVEARGLDRPSSALALEVSSPSLRAAIETALLTDPDPGLGPALAFAVVQRDDGLEILGRAAARSENAMTRAAAVRALACVNVPPGPWREVEAVWERALEDADIEVRTTAAVELDERAPVWRTRVRPMLVAALRSPGPWRLHEWPCYRSVRVQAACRLARVPDRAAVGALVEWAPSDSPQENAYVRHMTSSLLAGIAGYDPYKPNTWPPSWDPWYAAAYEARQP